MVLHILASAASELYSSKYLVHIIVAITSIYVVHAFSQGRKTNRERDLHARKIIITGGLTPLNLTLINALAQRGAHLIILTPQPISSDSETSVLIPLLRSTTSNQEIYAEHCDIRSPSSIRGFCERFLSGKEEGSRRIDALVLGHEYESVGRVGVFDVGSGGSGGGDGDGDGGKEGKVEREEREREAACLATFLIITLLLPSLLVAPVERDIRIINVVNPFYAAAIAGSSPISSSPSTSSKSNGLLLSEGLRSLRTIILTRHLQRILDALPSAQLPKTDDGSSSVPVVSAKKQKSNIVAVSVCPGISRSGTVGRMMGVDNWRGGRRSRFGIFLYILLQPILRIFTKSSRSAVQTILHALFLPTPFKVVGDTTASDEVLKPGALYSDCGVVRLNVLSKRFVDPDDSEEGGRGKAKEGEGEGEGGGMTIEDDGEYGGELAGRLVWEGYERALKAWEKANPATEEKKSRAPDTDTDSLPGGVPLDS